MTTSVTSELQTEWQEWHAARERELATPHGWLSLTSFHWLPDAPTALSGLPGLFSSVDGRAVLSARAEDGYAVANCSAPVDGSVSAVVAEAKSSVWLTLGAVAIELARRGGRYAIRTRDPQAAARSAFVGVPAFDLDEKWLLEGRFTPFDTARRIAVGTARSDLTQQITGVGTVTLDVGGDQRSFIATAGAGGTLSIAFHDATNGVETAPWRAVSTTAPDAAGRVIVDFNRAINFAFAFSEYGTCPAPPAGNSIPVAVTAGELAPRVVQR